MNSRKEIYNEIYLRHYLRDNEIFDNTTVCIVLEETTFLGVDFLFKTKQNHFLFKFFLLKEIIKTKIKAQIFNKIVFSITL